MRARVLAAALAACLAAAEDRGSWAAYIGGTLSALPAGAEGGVRTSDPVNFEFQCRKALVRVPYSKINLIEYGQSVGRRYALAVLISPMLLLSKKRAHFLTVGYMDDGGQQQALVFRLDKGQVRAVLASLEARTGLKVQYQDEEARKGNRG